MKMLTDPPVVSLVGSSGSGKTTFLEKLIPCLVAKGFAVGTIKHDTHGFDMDVPGKDSWRLKKAGARVSLVASPFQIGMVRDTDYDRRPDELAEFFPDVDIIIAEGYKRARINKIEVFRREISERPVCGNDEYLMAMVSDSAPDTEVPCFGLDEAEAVADFIVSSLNLIACTAGNQIVLES